MKKTIRWVLALTVLAALYIGGRAAGLDQYLQADYLRNAVASAGSLGPLLFLAIFIGAVLAQIPGIPFVILAPTLFHWPTAIFLSFLASNVAVLLNFEIVRRLGGDALTRIRNPYLQRILDSLDAHPVRAVFLLRLLTIMFPPVTGALALTSVSRRDHAVGSALGMIAPLLALLAAGGMLVR